MIHIVVAMALLTPVAGSAPVSSAEMAQSSVPADCSEWHVCRDMALAAAERHEYERFHDLAWRAVQTGPSKNAELMFLLARAQALSNRPHDALVMLGRIAELGVAVDASGDEFARTRQLPQWPEVEARIAAVVAPSPASAASAGSSSSASPSSSAASAPSAVSAPSAASNSVAKAEVAPATAMPVVTLATGSQSVRFTAAKSFAVSGLAYDASSRRFVLADRDNRKLMIVDERSTADAVHQPIDLVRAESAGFQDILAMEIDGARGDLWAASNATDGSGIVHRVQLVSGRPLRSYPVDASLQPVKLVDLAVDRTGVVLALDSAKPRLLALRPGRTAVERVMDLDLADPVSLAAGLDESTVFVAYRDGVARVDLRARRISRLTLPKGLTLGRIERLRWHDNALIAVQQDAQNTRQLLRLELNGRGTAVTRASRLETAAGDSGETFVTLSGEELVFLRRTPKETELVVSRVPLR